MTSELNRSIANYRRGGRAFVLSVPAIPVLPRFYAPGWAGDRWCQDLAHAVSPPVCGGPSTINGENGAYRLKPSDHRVRRQISHIETRDSIELRCNRR